MKLIIKLLGTLIALFGILILIYPENFVYWIEDNSENITFYIAAIATRLLFGILFILAAKDSKYPIAIKFFGYIAIIAALTFIFIGHTGFKDFVFSMIPHAKLSAPILGLFGITFGCFLIYAFSRKKELD